MPDQDVTHGWVGLSEALTALREDLETAWGDGTPTDGKPVGVRFKIDPFVLTIQIGATRASKGSVGVKWHILALGGDHAREHSSTQTLKIRLTPLLVDEQGKPLPENRQHISDSDD
jgi:hypothetical protein